MAPSLLPCSNARPARPVLGGPLGLRSLGALSLGLLSLGLQSLGALAAAPPASDATPATAAPPPAMAAVAAPTRFVLPLARLIGDDHPVRLSSVAASMTVSLPLPALWQPDDVKLELVGVNSRALLRTSQLEVAVNGHVVRQLALDGAQENFRSEIAVPTELLRPGFNEVKLSVAQHYADKCEYPMASQLWTDINLTSSRFVVGATPKAVVARLDRLDTLFDKAVLSEATPQIDVLTAAAPAGPVLAAAGLVAQGIGHRYDYAPVRIGSGRYPRDPAALGPMLSAASRGAVLIGSFASLAPYLDGLGIPADAGPVAAVRALPGDATRFLVILAARDDNDLTLAATAFAMQRMPWPDQPWVALRSLKMPPVGAISSVAATLKPSTQAFPLSSLGYATTTYSGLPTGSAQLRFWNASWQGRTQLRLHLSYGSGMAAQSALNVLANDALHGSIPLNNPNGGVYDNYAVTLPSGSLRPGWNTLTLQPVLVPQTNGGECKPFFLGNLAVTVYDDSTMQSFGGSPLQRPDLALLARDGRPAPDAPVGLGMAVQLTDNDDPTVGAGLTLMGKLSQVFHGPLLRVRFAVGEDGNAKNRLWVGTLARLPEAVRQRAGLGEGGSLRVSVPLIRSVQVPVLEGGETLRDLREALEGDDASPRTVEAEVALDDMLSQHAVAATVFDGERPLTVFTASRPELLLAGLHDIVGYGPWGQLRGGLAFWRPGQAGVQSAAAEDAPFTAYSLRGGLGLWVSQYPWWSLAILLIVVVAMVLLTRVLLASYRRRHLPAQVGLRRDDKGGAA